MEQKMSAPRSMGKKAFPKAAGNVRGGLRGRQRNFGQDSIRLGVSPARKNATTNLTNSPIVQCAELGNHRPHGSRISAGLRGGGPRDIDTEALMSDCHASTPLTHSRDFEQCQETVDLGVLTPVF